ncbi:MAG: DUF4142 domain-containing protein [Acetobacteraceae bacterium]
MSRSTIIGGLALTALACGAFGAVSASAQTKATLTDPQIAHIVYTADTIDIENGELALKKSKNTRVDAFARDMIRDHTAVNEKALALVKKLNVTPADNATSQSLVKQADAERAKLSALNGAAFDKAYIANEVAFHKEAIGEVETTLIPSAQNAELKGLLQAGLKIFQGHLQHAEQLDAALK